MVDTVLEAINRRDWTRFANLYSDSSVQYSPDRRQPIKGQRAIREYIENHVRAFPDVRLEKIRSFGQGDWVCLEFSWMGTHKGTLPGDNGDTIPATNRSVRLQETVLIQIRDGKIVEVHEYFDQLALMEQLGMNA